jgi:membrane fusion protein, multidrug efflux system
MYRFLCVPDVQVDCVPPGIPDGAHEIIVHMESERLPHDTPAPKPSRHWLSWLIGGIALIAVAGVIVYQSVTFLSQPQQRRGRFLDTGLQPVGVARIHRGDIKLVVRALGAVTPLTTVTVNSQISGQLMSVGFKEGQLVKKGQFLAQIDPRPYQVALEQDQAQLARDDATLKQAQMDLTRYQTLAQQASIPRQTAEDQVWIVKTDQGTVDFDKAQIRAQELNLVYCHIVAPADGRLGLRLVDPGNYVTVGATTGIVVITLLKPISVLFAVPEDSVPQIMARFHAGAKMPVTVFDRANVKQLATGAFAAIDNEVNPTTGTVNLRATFDNPDDSLFPSQFVNVVMLLDTLKDVVTVPIAAVQRGAPGTYVYKVNQGNSVSVHAIQLGVQDGDFFAVESGLSPGDQVVTDGADRLRDGAHVSIPAASPHPSGTSARGADAGSGERPNRPRHRRSQQGDSQQSGNSQPPASPRRRGSSQQPGESQQQGSPQPQAQ